MPRKPANSNNAPPPPPANVVERTERVFVTKEDGLVKIVSDERGDEAAIRSAKLSLVNAVTIEGVAEKEPILLIHFEGGGVVQVTFNSRTNVFKARQQFLDMVN